MERILINGYSEFLKIFWQCGGQKVLTKFGSWCVFSKISLLLQIFCRLIWKTDLSRPEIWVCCQTANSVATGANCMYTHLTVQLFKTCVYLKNLKYDQQIYQEVVPKKWLSTVDDKFIVVWHKHRLHQKMFLNLGSSVVVCLSKQDKNLLSNVHFCVLAIYIFCGGFGRQRIWEWSTFCVFGGYGRQRIWQYSIFSNFGADGRQHLEIIYF